MPTYHFAYTCFLNAAEIAYLPELVGYLRGTSPVVESIEEIDMSGTDFADDQRESIEDPTKVLRVVITGTVQATHSDPSLHGGLPGWEGSAQDRVEEESFAYTDTWDVGFVHMLKIAETPDERVGGFVESHLIGGQPLPLPTRILTQDEIAALLVA